MRNILSIAMSMTTIWVGSLSAQVPLSDPEVARREEAERGYVSAMKSDLRLLASAEEAYFVDNMGYFAGTVDARTPLYGFKPSKNISLKVTGGGRDGSMWTATAIHALTTTKCTYHLPDPIDCSAPRPVVTPTVATAAESNTSRPGESPASTAITLGSTRPVGLRPGESRTWGWVIAPDRNSCVVTGRVEGVSGVDGRLNVLILSDSAYKEWRAGRWTRTYYESGERSTIAFEVNITDPGRYLLVVANASKTDSRTVRFEQTQVSCS